MWADESAHMIGHHNWVQSLHSKQCCSLHASLQKETGSFILLISFLTQEQFVLRLWWFRIHFIRSISRKERKESRKKKKKEKTNSCPYLQKPLAIDSPGTHEKKQKNNRNFRKGLWNRISLTPRRIKCKYIHLIYAMCSEGENICNSFAFTKRMRSE